MNIQKKIDELNEKMVNIKKDVSPEDKAAALLEYGIGIRTQERYLDGDVKSIPVGNSLYTFFNKRISKRDLNVA